MKRNHFKIYASAFILALGVVSCTDLEIEETDSFIDEGFQGLENTESAVNQLYAQTWGLLGNQEDQYAIREVTTDALLVPTRGADWGDNGRWRKLHQHEWGLEEIDIIRPFDQWNANQLLGSQILDDRSNASPQDWDLIGATVDGSDETGLGELANAAAIKSYLDTYTSAWKDLDTDDNEVDFNQTTAANYIWTKKID